MRTKCEIRSLVAHDVDDRDAHCPKCCGDHVANGFAAPQSMKIVAEMVHAADARYSSIEPLANCREVGVDTYNEVRKTAVPPTALGQQVHPRVAPRGKGDRPDGLRNTLVEKSYDRRGWPSVARHEM